MDISIVILTWNGLEFLKICLPSVVKAAGNHNGDCEIIVVDNGSSDRSRDYLRENFPKINIIELKENFNFSKAMNMGFKSARHPIVIGLNNDIIAEEDFIPPLVRHFLGNGGLFAVAAKMLLWDRQTLNFGRAIGSFRFGIFRRKLVDTSSAVNTLYACAGAFAVDRSKFLELGGFDEDMLVYWEDADLCYRAWKRGWKTLYEPASVIYHKSHGTYGVRFGEKGIRRISGENYFLFALKNIHDKGLIFQQLFFLPMLMLASVLMGKPHFAKGLFLSIRRWPLFLQKRRAEKKDSLLSDREVFRISSR